MNTQETTQNDIRNGLNNKTMKGTQNKSIEEIMQEARDNQALKRVKDNNYDNFKEVIQHQHKKIGKLNLYAISNSVTTGREWKRYNLIVIERDNIIINYSNVVDITSDYGTIEDTEQALNSLVKYLNSQLAK